MRAGHARLFAELRERAPHLLLALRELTVLLRPDAQLVLRLTKPRLVRMDRIDLLGLLVEAHSELALERTPAARQLLKLLVVMQP